MESSASAKAALREHAIFRPGAAEALDRLFARARARSLGPGDILCRKGDVARDLSLILSGLVRVSASSSAGKEVVFNIMGAGELFGEIALFDRGGRSADAVALTAVGLLSIDRRDFEVFLEASPRSALVLLELLAKRVRYLSGLVEDARLVNLSGRLAQLLLRLQGLAADGVVGFSQSELADMSFASREEVNRQLKSWEREGLVRIVRKGLVVTEPQGLEAEAAPRIELS